MDKRSQTGWKAALKRNPGKLVFTTFYQVPVPNAGMRFSRCSADTRCIETKQQNNLPQNSLRLTI